MSWKLSHLVLAGTLASVLEGGVEAQTLTPRTGPQPTAAMKARLQAAFGNVPLNFIENRGQTDRRVAYYVQGRDTTVYFNSTGVTVALTGARPDGARQRWAVKLDFVGANPASRPVGDESSPALVSYFKGPRDRWKTGLRTYSSLVYSDLWPGIDLAFTGTVNRLKYTFLIHPGADPARIKLAYRGAAAVALTGAGELEVSSPVGSFRDERPYAYQEVGGRRVEVPAVYELGRETAAGVHGYGFSLGPYDRTMPLVLDPAMLVYAGYVGGNDVDAGSGIAVDNMGNAYVSGLTASTEATFPVTAGPDATFNGNVDAFVAKVNAAGTALVYAGYIGGAGNDQGRGIAVDSAGSAYVTGFTSSSQTSFPVTVGPDLTQNGDFDAFVAKVDPAGTALVYAGYIGGTGFDVGSSIAVDSAGAAYVGGFTNSSQSSFPVTGGPDLTFNGSDDAFVAKVNVLGTALVYAGYIGGADADDGFGIAVDSAGSAYVTGQTNSSQATFPATVGPDLMINGGLDAFVAKVNALGTGLVYAGYIGGAGTDFGRGIAVDSAGNAYVTGATQSTEVTFLPTGGPDVTFNGVEDAFVAKVNSLGTGFVYAGYIGGAGQDEGFGIAVDSAGNAYVTGHTFSSEATFPVTGGPDLTYNGSGDAFVAKVNTAGAALAYAGYVGGSALDEGVGIAVDNSGSAYVAGQTSSSAATFPVTVGPDLTYGGNRDAFVAKIGGVGTPATLTLDPPAATNPVDTQHCVTATVEDTDGSPVPDVTVRFTVTGSASATGSGVTDENGQATFCYMGPPLPGSDLITAYADTDNDNTQDSDEPVGTATKAWVLPPTTPLCEIKITNGGWFIANNGDRASFGGNARASDTGETQGQEQYQDHGPIQPLNVHSINVLAIVCDGTTQASIYGQATNDGAGSYNYRIRVRDMGEPGKGVDTYWMLLQNGYNSGEHTLSGGNVQIHRD